MLSRLAFLAAISFLSGLAGAQAQDSAAARFAGVWEGTQQWATANPPPGATEPQPVTLALAESAGQWSGTMTPFLGGSDGATLSDVRISGNQLRADAVIGDLRTFTAGQDDEAPFWKDVVQIAFTFNAPDSGKLTGTAALTMGGVPWLKFQYTLTRRPEAPR